MRLISVSSWGLLPSYVLVLCAENHAHSDVQVQPTSKMGEESRCMGGKVALFNAELGNHADEADFVFLGSCEERLVEVFGI